MTRALKVILLFSSRVRVTLRRLILPLPHLLSVDRARPASRKVKGFIYSRVVVRDIFELEVELESWTRR